MLRRLLAVSLLALTTACAPQMMGQNVTTVSGGADRRVQLVNASRSTIVQFYASNAKRSTWEEDILGQSVLEPGRAVMINIDDGTGSCIFDFLTVMQSGQRLERRGINVCEVSTYTVR